MPKWDVPFYKFVDGFCFKKYIFIKRKNYELKSFFVFLVGDAANEENEEGGGWRSYVYCSSWKSFTWCSHIRRLDSRTQSRKGKQPITSSSLWRNRSHSCSYGRTWFSKEWGSFLSRHVFDVTLQCISKALVCFKQTLSSYPTKDKCWRFSITCFHKRP